MVKLKNIWIRIKWYELTLPEIDNEYSLKDAAIEMVKNDNTGPWSEEKKVIIISGGHSPVSFKDIIDKADPSTIAELEPETFGLIPNEDIKIDQPRNREERRKAKRGKKWY